MSDKIVSIFENVPFNKGGDRILKIATAFNYGFAIVGLECPNCGKKCDCSSAERNFIMSIANDCSSITCPFCHDEFEVQLAEHGTSAYGA